ncbi:MAG: DUF6600 domain-containing protein [Verrucomicrobiota bacterium]
MSRKVINGKMAPRNEGVKVALACLAIGWMCWSAGDLCLAQSTPADFSPGLQHVVNLSKGGMSDDFILTYITNSGTSYTLSDDDIIYLHKQGVSDGVIKALIQTTTPANPTPPAAPAATPANTNPTNSVVAPAAPTPPPLDAGPGVSPAAPAPTSPAAPSAPPAPMPVAVPVVAPLQDVFYTDAGLNPGLWTTQSGTLSALASMSGAQVFPVLRYSPSGMRMSGIRRSGEWMGIQSTAGFSAPFTFSATVAGLAQNATPFEIYLVSGDLQQWVSVAGHLGGRGGPRSEVFVGGGFGHVMGDVGIPVGGGRSPDYGVWINHTGSGLPISSLGYKLLENPIAGVAYTVQITLGADGSASIALINSAGAVLAAQNVPVGTGPFYVVLAGHGGQTAAEWQSVQLTPAAPPVVEAAPAPPTPTLGYFQSQLAPYGNWVTVPGYGICWQPSVDPGWRPYYDGGHWVYSDDGWYWQSDYPWGDIAFHYGRWAYTASGWVWVPGYDYAPAWVVWRHADDDGYVGWAPLPPGAVLVDGGWVYNGARVGVDFDFGLGAGFFTFVGYDHFWEHDYRRFVVPHDRLALIYRRSVFENHYRTDHGRFINDGLNRDRMAAFTHQDIRPVAAQDLRRREEQRNVEVRRDDLHNYRPGNIRPNAIKPVESDHGSGHSSSGGRDGNNKPDQR